MPNPLERITQRSEQPVHDNQNVNANMQVGDTDVSGGNPVPVTGAGGAALPTERFSELFTQTIANGAHLSDEFDMQEYVAGDVYIPAAWTAANIGFHVAHTTGGTFVPAYDDNGNLIESTVGAVTDRVVALPPEIAGFRFVKLWSQNAGVNAAQGGDRTMYVELKS